MPVEKLSVSFDAPLAATVRKAAAKEGLSISTWLAEAAAAKARQEHLRDALDAFADEYGVLDDTAIAELVRSARTSSRVTGPRAPRGAGGGKSSKKVAPSKKVA